MIYGGLAFLEGFLFSFRVLFMKLHLHGLTTKFSVHFVDEFAARSRSTLAELSSLV